MKIAATTSTSVEIIPVATNAATGVRRTGCSRPRIAGSSPSAAASAAARLAPMLQVVMFVKNV